MTRLPTLFLMADPDFWFGPARVFDLFGQFDQLNFSRTREEADARAIAADWTIVGDDLQAAFEEYRQQLEAVQRQQFILPFEKAETAQR